MRTIMRLCMAAVLAIMLFQAGGALAAPPVKTVDTGQPFAAFLDRLKGAVAKNKMGIVAQACADCGARSIGVTIPGNRVIMIFHPRFAVRMLKASIPAGIEAPLRLYITERPDGTARLSYPLPSDVFAPYGSADLDRMAAELDDIFAAIVRDATR